jgi:GH15 family glucan-1,4-alpha-glucosidase
LVVILADDSVYTIHGGKDLEEITLDHLEGHKGSKPVRIGNGAADHKQLVGLSAVEC